MTDYINELYREKETLRSSIIERDRLGSSPCNTARALAAMDSVSNRLREDIRAIDNEIDFLQAILSGVMNHNAGEVINQMGGLHLRRERVDIGTVRLSLIVGEYLIPAEYSLLVYRDDKQALSKQLGDFIGRTLYQLIQPSR